MFGSKLVETIGRRFAGFVEKRGDRIRRGDPDSTDRKILAAKMEGRSEEMGMGSRRNEVRIMRFANDRFRKRPSTKLCTRCPPFEQTRCSFFSEARYNVFQKQLILISKISFGAVSKSYSLMKISNELCFRKNFNLRIVYPDA